MARGGRKYPLVIYREILDRWWPETLVLGLIMVVLAWPVYKHPLGQAEPWRWKWLIGIGVGIMVLSLVLLAMRGMAYVQVFPTHVRLVTPFLRLNVSYKRLLRSTTVEMQTLFPPNKIRGWKRKVVAPLGGRTAVVLDMKGWPASPQILRIFLSHFFFKDKTAHFVILVDDWMRFSTELDSMRRSEGIPQPHQPRSINQSILSRLPRKDQ